MRGTEPCKDVAYIVRDGYTLEVGVCCSQVVLRGREDIDPEEDEEEDTEMKDGSVPRCDRDGAWEAVRAGFKAKGLINDW